MSEFSAIGWGPFAATARTLLAMLVLYGVLVLASLGAAWATRRGSSLRAQINAWWLIFPVVSACLLLYPWGPALLMWLIAFLALRELAALHATPRHYFWGVGAAVWLLQMALAWWHAALATSVLAGLLLLQALVFVLRRQRSHLLLLLFLLLCLGLSFLPLLLQHTPMAGLNLAWFFYLLALTALNDIAQFIGGKCFGRHKIAARISPQKTWQGLLAGVFASMLISLLLGRYLRLADAPLLVGLGVGLSLAGFVGDLLYSAGKRRLGIKDYSALIPGHGGMLDRVDSLVLTAPMLYLGLLI
ncbi:phosphatidate cytidylyltransferase [Variovorax sp. HJSM1_2]|uniref:phosphatidate cytidylyltransferase n=1 Tax=Variovorax sp. HJSM1_2 TaxID=3366263 RepID=UPI003BDDEC92